VRADVGARALQVDDEMCARMNRRQRRDLQRVEHAEDVQLPFLG
jgi:hypothetical protein